MKYIGLRHRPGSRSNLLYTGGWCSCRYLFTLKPLVQATEEFHVSARYHQRRLPQHIANEVVRAPARQNLILRAGFNGSLESVAVQLAISQRRQKFTGLCGWIDGIHGFRLFGFQEDMMALAIAWYSWAACWFRSIPKDFTSASPTGFPAGA